MNDKYKPIVPVGFWNWILAYLAFFAIGLHHFYIACVLTVVFGYNILHRKKHPDQIKPDSLSRKQKLITSIAVVIITLFIGIATTPSDSSDTSNAAIHTTRHSNANAKKKKQMLKILNQWADDNNDFGKVKINEENMPVLVLNDETANADKEDLNRIAIQFSNKVRAQKEMTGAKVREPQITDEDDAPIAVWNGSTLELTDK